jgi:hypothetical protein
VGVLHRTMVPAFIVLAMAGTTAATPGRPTPYEAPAPAAVPALVSPSSLNARFGAVERNIRTARATADRTKDDDRGEALDAFLAPGRRFLSFDPRGKGRVVEVFGDLVTAERVAVVVPGADGLLTNFDNWKWAGGGARALYRQARASAPSTRMAVVAWLGYDSPSTRSPAVLTDGRADDASRELTRFLTDLRRVNNRAGVALLCHSYGSVVCAKAAPRLAERRLPIADIAFYGSPGVGVPKATALKTRARVWAGRSSGDWMNLVPNLRIGPIGFGQDPADPSFGAVRFDAGTGPHSGYLRPRSVPLRILTLIALGQAPEDTHARHA